MLIGSLASAQERQLGTLEWQTCCRAGVAAVGGEGRRCVGLAVAARRRPAGAAGHLRTARPRDVPPCGLARSRRDDCPDDGRASTCPRSARAACSALVAVVPDAFWRPLLAAPRWSRTRSADVARSRRCGRQRRQFLRRPDGCSLCAGGRRRVSSRLLRAGSRFAITGRRIAARGANVETGARDRRLHRRRCGDCACGCVR